MNLSGAELLETEGARTSHDLIIGGVAGSAQQPPGSSGGDVELRCPRSYRGSPQTL